MVTVTQPGFSPWSFGNWFYRPLFLATFAELYKAFGLNAVAWHIVELLLHMVNVALVYYLIKRLKFSQMGSTAGALAFGVFPLSTNAVAWLSAISGVGSAALCLVAAHIALSDRIPVLLRGVLCVVVWAPALFLKEESASMIVVLPFLPMFTTTKRSRREWAVWFTSCMLMVGALVFFIHLEGQCQHTLGNANARISLELLRRAATFLLWPTSMGLPIFAASEIWILAILAFLPVTLWLMYPSLRPGLFWLIATGLAIGVALKFLAPAGRYFYIPSVGICMCIAALTQRLFLANRPFPFADRFIAALMIVWVVSISSLPPYIAIVAGLVALFWRGVSDQKDALDRGRAITVLATACVFSLLEYLSVSLTGIGYFPFYLTMTLPLIIATIFLVRDRAHGRQPLNWHKCILFFCLAFWTKQPAALIFLLVLILARLIENKNLKLSVKPIEVWAGLLAAAVITLPWAVSSLERNLTWLESGHRIRSATSMTAHLMSRLPKGSRVTIVDNAGFAFPEPHILQVISRMIARRPDIAIRQSQKIDPRVYNIVCDNRWHIRLYPPDN